MFTGLTHLHSLLRWIALLAIVISIVKSYGGLSSRRLFNKSDNRWSLITLIAFHIQLIIGLALYFWQGWYERMGDMGDKLNRFFAVEHLAGMLVAIILITLGRVLAKKSQSDLLKFQRTFWFYLIALILVLISIPWPFREVGLGRSWFPGI